MKINLQLSAFRILLHDSRRWHAFAVCEEVTTRIIITTIIIIIQVGQYACVALLKLLKGSSITRLDLSRNLLKYEGLLPALQMVTFFVA